MGSDVVLKQSRNYVARKLGEETVLVPINQTGVEVQRIFALNSTAADIWEKLDQPKTVEELIEFLKNEYSADESVIRSDVENILQEFLQAGFLEEVRK